MMADDCQFPEQCGFPDCFCTGEIFGEDVGKEVVGDDIAFTVSGETIAELMRNFKKTMEDDNMEGERYMNKELYDLAVKHLEGLKGKVIQDITVRNIEGQKDDDYIQESNLQIDIYYKESEEE